MVRCCSRLRDAYERTTTLTLACLAALAAVLTTTVRIPVPLSNVSETPLEKCDIPSEIRQLEWSADAATRAAALGVPVLFKNTGPLLALPALNWTWSDVAKTDAEATVEVARGSPEFFYFDADDLGLLDHRNHHPALSRLTEPGPRSRRAERMHMHDLVGRMTGGGTESQDEQGGDFFYLTAAVLQPSGIDEDGVKFADAFRPHFVASSNDAGYVDTSLVVDERAGADGGGADNAILSVWFGGPGPVTTQAHYDEPHNMFVQLIGTKRFTLLPPCFIDALPIYPDLHVRARKAQIPLSQISELAKNKTIGDLKFPLHKKLSTRMLEVDVEPGDVLYVPPFWIHRVQVTSSAAASCNSFTPSNISATRAAIYRHALPFEERWIGTPTAGAATHLWLLELVEKRLGWSLLDAARRLVDGRYRWMMVPRSNVSHNCYPVASSVNDGVSPGRFSAYADTISGLFLDISNDGVRWQILLSYVELVIHNVLGGTDKIKPFLMQCVLGV